MKIDGSVALVTGASFIDTDMAALTNAPKDTPESVAQQVFDAVEAGQVEVLADERTRTVKAELSRDHELIYPPVQVFWDAAVTGTPMSARRMRTGSALVRGQPRRGSARRAGMVARHLRNGDSP